MSIVGFANIFDYLVHNLYSFWQFLQIDAYEFLFQGKQPWQISGLWKELYWLLHSSGITDISVLECIIYLAGAGFATYALWVLTKFLIPI